MPVFEFYMAENGVGNSVAALFDPFCLISTEYQLISRHGDPNQAIFYDFSVIFYVLFHFYVLFLCRLLFRKLFGNKDKQRKRRGKKPRGKPQTKTERNKITTGKARNATQR